MQGKFTKDKKPTPAHPKEIDSLQQSVSSLMASISEEKKQTIQFLVDLVKEFKKDNSLTEDAREVKVVNQLILTHRDYLKKLITKDTTTIEELGSIVDLTDLDLSAITKNLKLNKDKVLSLVKKSIERVKVEDKIEIKYKPKVKTLYKILENKIAGEEYFKNVSEFCEKRIEEKFDKEIKGVSKRDMSKDFGDVTKKRIKRKNPGRSDTGQKLRTKTQNITKTVLKIRKIRQTQKQPSVGKQSVPFKQVGLTFKVPTTKQRKLSIPTVPKFNKRQQKKNPETVQLLKHSKETEKNNLASVVTSIPKVRRRITNVTSPSVSKSRKKDISESVSSVAKSVNPNVQKKPEYTITVGKDSPKKEVSQDLPEKRKILGFISIPSFRKEKTEFGKVIPVREAEKKEETSFKGNFLIGFNSTQKFIQNTMWGLLKRIPGMILRGVLSGVKLAIFKVIKLVCPVAGFLLKLIKPLMFLIKWVAKGAKIAFHAVGKALSFSFGVIKKSVSFITVGWIKGIGWIHKKIMKILKSNIVKKIVEFLFSPKGAFILGFIVGFLYKNVYLPIKNNWDKIKRFIKKAYLKTKTTILRSILSIGEFYNNTFLPGYEKVREFANDLDTEKLDKMALDFKMKVYYPIIDVFDFLKESVMQVPSLAGSAVGAAIGSVFGPIGTIAGGLIGGLVGGLVTDAFGDKFKDEIDERTKKENRERDIVASYGFSEKTNRRKNIIAEAMKRRDGMSDNELKKNVGDLDKLQKMQDANRYFMNSDDEEKLIPEEFDVSKLGKQINDELVETKDWISKGGANKTLETPAQSKIPLPGDVPYKDTLMKRYVRAILLSRMYNWFQDGMISKWNLYTYYRDMMKDGQFSESVMKETLYTRSNGLRKIKKLTVEQILSSDDSIYSDFKDNYGNNIKASNISEQMLNLETETHDQAKVSDQFIKDQVEGVISQYYGVVFEGIPKEDIPEATEILRSFLIKSYNSGRWKLGEDGKLVFTEHNAKEVNANMRNLFQTIQMYNETLQSHKFVHMANLGRVDMTQIRQMYESSSKELDKMLKEDEAMEQENKKKTETELNESGKGMVKAVVGNVVEKVKNRKQNQELIVQNRQKSELFSAV